jgi:glycosyltransferase involved in cell wall biosynthesis
MLKRTAVGFRTARALRGDSLVIHANYQGLPFLKAALLFGFKLSGFRLVLTINDVLPHRWFLPRPLRFLEWATLWGTYLVADKLVVYNREALVLLRNEFGTRPRKVIEIPHGPFRLSDAPLPYAEGEEIVALLLGALRENKNIHLAIRAVQKVRADGYPVKLVIAGKSYALEKSYWQRCKALIETSPAGITVMDRYLEDEEMKDIVAGAHLLLLPYAQFHSQSGVAALALSNGRPIVATRAGGLSELLLPGRTGIPIELPTVESVEEALLRAVRLGHDGLRQMGREAFAFFNTSYSWDAIAREYIALYEEVGIRPRR